MSFTYVADLVAFAEINKLPTNLLPFVRIPALKDDKESVNVHVAVFKIRGTIDSYHAIVVKKGMTLQQINEKIKNELPVVTLSIYAEKKLSELIEKFNFTGSVHFVFNVKNKEI